MLPWASYPYLRLLPPQKTSKHFFLCVTLSYPAVSSPVEASATPERVAAPPSATRPESRLQDLLSGASSNRRAACKVPVLHLSTARWQLLLHPPSGPPSAAHGHLHPTPGCARQERCHPPLALRPMTYTPHSCSAAATGRRTSTRKHKGVCSEL
jgi:hypothetical protein